MKDLKQFIKTTIREFLNENQNILLAPNGNKSNLSKENYEYVRTDEFKKWFGDWENDSENASNLDREVLKTFLAEMFPNKSKYEL